MIPFGNPLVRIALGLGGLALVVAAIMWYGHSKYQAGVRDTDAAWHAAEQAMLAKAAGAASAADRAAAASAANYAGQVAKEKEAINEAVLDGRSPFDGLFPAAGR